VEKLKLVNRKDRKRKQVEEERDNEDKEEIGKEIKKEEALTEQCRKLS
jgi:hypothetical protein